MSSSDCGSLTLSVYMHCARGLPLCFQVDMRMLGMPFTQTRRTTYCLIGLFKVTELHNLVHPAEIMASRASSFTTQKLARSSNDARPYRLFSLYRPLRYTRGDKQAQSLRVSFHVLTLSHLLGTGPSARRYSLRLEGTTQLCPYNMNRLS